MTITLKFVAYNMYCMLHTSQQQIPAIYIYVTHTTYIVKSWWHLCCIIIQGPCSKFLSRGGPIFGSLIFVNFFLFNFFFFFKKVGGGG